MVQGPTYNFEINGGYCYIVTETKAVTCVKPTVTLNMDPGVCSLKYTTPTTVFVSFSSPSLVSQCQVFLTVVIARRLQVFKGETILTCLLN